MTTAKLVLLTKEKVAELTSYRPGEIKFGERVHLVQTLPNWVNELKQNTCKYVVLGIPEDIGVKANFGRPGTAAAWESFLRAFLNIQHNRFAKGSAVTILGHLDFKEEMTAAATLDPAKREDKKALNHLVEAIDKEVSHVIAKIVSIGKIPIIIGGGHNNAYGNIKGCALGKGKPINAINFDAHTDFRPLEGRHSGNGFSYAYEENFLRNYFIFGLHENYTSKGVFQKIRESELQVRYNTYEQMEVRKEKSFENELLIAQKHVDYSPFGIEIDLDAVPLMASSAITPSGFSAERLRQFLHFFAQSKYAAYLHICEGAPTLDFPQNSHLIGKFMAYLVTDFMKANLEKK